MDDRAEFIMNKLNLIRSGLTTEFVNEHSLYAIFANPGYCWVKLIKSEFRLLVALTLGAYPKASDLVIILIGRSPSTLFRAPNFVATEFAEIAGSYTVEFLSQNYLHIEVKEGSLGFNDVVTTLASRENFLVGGGVHEDVLKVAEMEQSLYLPAAQEYVRSKLESSRIVTTPLSGREEKMLQKAVDFELRFVPKQTSRCDHPLLAAMRELVRQDLDRLIKQGRDTKTLFLGATMREVYKWHQNTSFHYHIASAEGKDTSRVTMSAFDKLSTDLAKCAELFPEYFVDGELKLHYKDTQDLLDDVGLLLGIEGNLTNRIRGSFVRLIAEDSLIYHYTWEDYYRLFESTDANELLVTGILPIELLGRDVAKSPLYNYTEDGEVFRKATLTYCGGTSNGYTHPVAPWRTLIKYPAYNGKRFNLVAEEICRVGPQVLIRVMKTFSGGDIVREYTLAKEPLIKYLDFRASSKPEGGKVTSWVYKVGVKEEFLDALLYVHSVDPKAVNVTTVASYIRRKFGGAALINRELSSPWELESEDLLTMATAVYVQYILDRVAMENILEKNRFDSCLERLRAGLMCVAYYYTWAFWETISFFLQHRFQEKVHIFLPQSVTQSIHLDEKVDLGTQLTLSLKQSMGPFDPTTDTCECCQLFEGKLGLQKIICPGVPYKYVDLSLNQAELDALFATLAADDNDPPGLKKVKEDAKRALPKTPFSRRVKLFLMVGGPGTGKSTLARQILTAEDGVYAPFSKLKQDYMRTSSGEAIDFKTLHRGFLMGAKKRLHVDEYTAIPYEYLASVVFLCGADEVFFWGDEKQTGTRLSEGIPIKTKFDLTKGHVLYHNFRNNDATVDWLVKYQGYTMGKHPARSRPGPMYKFARHPSDEQVQKTAFSSLTLLEVEADNTVRQVQGSTFPTQELFITPKDLAMLAIPELKIVASTRCEDTFTIVCPAEIEAEIDRIMTTVNHYPVNFSKDKKKSTKADKVSFVAKLLSRRLGSEKDKSYYTDSITEGYRREMENLCYDAIAQRNLSMVLINACDCMACRFQRRDDCYSARKKFLKPEIFKIGFDADLFVYRTELCVAGPPSYEEISLDEALPRSSEEKLPFTNETDDIPTCQVPYEKQPEVAHKISEAISCSFVYSSDQNDSEGNTNLFLTFEQVYSSVNTVIDYDLIEAGGSPTNGALLAPSRNICGLVALSLQTGLSVQTLWDKFANHVGWDYAASIHSSERYWDVSELAQVCKLLGINLFVFSTTLIPRGDSHVYDYQDLIAGYKFENAVGTVSIFYSPGHFFTSSNTRFPLTTLLRTMERKLALGGDYVPTQHNQFPVVDDQVKTLEFADVATTFVPDFLDVTRSSELPTEMDTIPSLRATYDAFTCFSEFDTFKAVSMDVSRLNNLARMRKGKFTGKIIGNPLEPTNARGNPIKPKQCFSYGIGNAISFIQTDGFQELETLHARYMNKRKKSPFNLQAKQYAIKIADSFVKRNFDLDRAKFAMASTEFANVMNEFKKKVVSSNYLPQYKDYFSTDGRVVRFHMKDIVKPRLNVAGDKDISKAGQGISAWSKEAVTLFGAAFRAMTTIFRAAAKDHYVFNNGMTEQQAQAAFQKAISMVPFPVICTFDGEEFDAGQNLFTQAIEYRVWEQLGINKFMLDWYYSFRQKYFLIAKQAMGVIEEIKTSGENGTLVNNSIVSAAICDFITTGKGPFAIFNQGDDVLKAQSGITIDEDKRAIIAMFCNMGIKLHIGPDTEACGYSYYYGNFVANIRRKFVKVTSHRFRNPEHFYEFQVGLRDYVRKQRQGNLWLTFAVNAAQSNVKVQHVQEWFFALESMCHISWEQFISVARHTTDQTYYLTDGGFTTLW